MIQITFILIRLFSDPLMPCMEISAFFLFLHSHTLLSFFPFGTVLCSFVKKSVIQIKFIIRIRRIYDRY